MSVIFLKIKKKINITLKERASGSTMFPTKMPDKRSNKAIEQLITIIFVFFEK